MRRDPSRIISPSHALVQEYIGSFVRFLMVLCLISSLVPLSLPAKRFKESQVKSVFLFNLTKFITWPTKTASPEDKNFTIGILGENPFEPHLEQTVVDEKIMQRSIEIFYYQSSRDIEWQKMQILFIGADFYKDLSPLLERARKFEVLTVSDIRGFCDAGGMITLLKADQRVILEINIEETMASGFLVSSHVLKLARLIGKLPETGGSN